MTGFLRLGSVAVIGCFVAALLIMTVGTADAQQPDDRAPTFLEHLQDTEQWKEMDPEARMQMRQSLQPHGTPTAPQTSVAGFDVRDAEATFGADPWPRNDLNFVPDNAPIPAGDVNGDGVNDYIYRYTNVADDRTGDLSDRTDKTLLVFGGDADFSNRYYDELYYGNLQPAGNLTGESDNAHAVERLDNDDLRIYAGSDAGYLEVGTITADLPTVFQSIPVDLDGSGYDDLVFSDAFGSQVLVVFGGEEVSDLEVREYNLDVPTLFSPNATFAAGELGEQPSLARLIGDTVLGQDEELFITRYTIDENREITVEEEFPARAPDGFPLQGRAGFSRLAIADLDGSGETELVVQPDGLPDENTLAYPAENESYDTTPEIIAATQDVAPIGDLNDNGRTDFLLVEDEELFVSFTPENPSDGLTADASVATDINVGSGALTPFDTGVLPPFGAAPFGDVTGNGQTNAIVRITEGNTFGPRLIQATGSASIGTQDFEFDAGSFRGSNVWQPVTLGDWSGDGTDDIAFLTQKAGPGDLEGQVDLYLDESTPDGAPDLTLTHPENAPPSMAVTGDFTGNDQLNLAVSWRSEDTIVSIYEAGEGSAPIHTIELGDLADDIEPLFNFPDFAIGNVGDVNSSGTDDLLIGAAATDMSSTAFLYLGGSDISGTPDVDVNLEGLLFFPGSAIQPLGDINQNGADDFAVGVSGSAFGGSQDSGVFVFFGQDVDGSVPSFDTPDVDIKLQAEENELLQLLGFGMAVGDFNGDGTPDLAAKPFQFRDDRGIEGVEAIRIYNGGPGFDGTPDEKLFIPGDPIDFSGNGSGDQYLQRSTGELTTLPDITGDGSDDLLLGTTTAYTTNALIYAGNGGAAPEPSVLLRAPNQTWGLGTDNNNINSNNRSSAVGDFNGDGALSMVLPQVGDPNFRGSPAYAYPLTDPADTEPEEPVAEASAPVEEDGPAPFEENETGVSINFSGVSGSGSVEVRRFEGQRPAGGGTIGRNNISEYRFDISTSGDLTFGEDTAVQFSVDQLGGVTDPSDVTAFKRDIPGVGAFTELETTFDESENVLVVSVGSFSEFAFGSDTEPLFSYPESVAADITRSFGSAANPGDYRLVALPGTANTSVSDAIDGTAGAQWQAYRDDGSDEDFLIRFDEEPGAFTFEAGSGFWLTSIDDWTVDASYDAPALTDGGATTVPLNDGWTIVSNPFDRDVAWRSVREANDISQPLWRFDATDGFVTADTMASARSGEAYYVLNDAGQSDLELPYPATGGAADDFQQTVSTPPTLALSATPVHHEAPASTVQLGVSDRETTAQIAPPGMLEAVSLRIQPKAESADASGTRTNALLEAVRSPDGDAPESEGVTFDLTLTPQVDGPVKLTAGAIDALSGYEVALLNPETGTTHSLDTPVTVEPEGESMSLQVAIGSAAYVGQEREEIVPPEIRFTTYPNPVRDQATVEFTLPDEADVRLEVYDMLGRRVSTLTQESRQAGVHEVAFDVSNLASGTYFGRLQVDGQTHTQRITVVR